MIKIGVDIGSTTVKVVAVGEDGDMLFSRYERHNADAKDVVKGILETLKDHCGDVEAGVRMTGSVGMGFAEWLGLPFVQEVVAATKAVQTYRPDTVSMIDIGGEDAKVVFFREGRAVDLRMNGNCAGGTGAFIDQMAVLLGVGVGELDSLAAEAKQTYPIASRCGVFCKTDIQNLIAKNVSRADIAASILHAVAVQTVVTLAHGCEIKPPVLVCGGPLTFIPSLRKAFKDYLSLTDDDIILPEHGTLLPALGTALTDVDDERPHRLSDVIADVAAGRQPTDGTTHALTPIFGGDEEHESWKKRMSGHATGRAELRSGKQDVYIGIDSGSTTTKIVVTDGDANIIYSYYSPNMGNPIEAVENGLTELHEACRRCGAELCVRGSCSTGYGEDLIKAAFQLDAGIVETIAHYMAACHLDPAVSFILDIGGQDMKAIFVTNGVIDRIEINEACSSGCGSFIETFAKTLGYTAGEFAAMACGAGAPCDLGTRCTVFMNSKVKQALREGATVADIAAGLAYSVVKNCLYKVLKLRDVSRLGRHIVVQGGTMRNDAVVRALELLTGTEVTRCDVPELMGAYGCALYAVRHGSGTTSLDDMLAKAHYSQKSLHCKGCDNRCLVVRYSFDNGHEYYSGNRCERVFSNGGHDRSGKGVNAYNKKNELLFNRDWPGGEPLMTIGIPRCLNMYEDYPFWHTLFTACGIKVVLSAPSRFAAYEHSACMVMSDNICFPAKLVHSHIQNFKDCGVDRIFMPFVVYGRLEAGQNSYNCPIVTGYAEVVKSVQGDGIPVDSPTVSFKDRKLLFRQCCEYLATLGIDKDTAGRAFAMAVGEQDAYEHDIAAYDERLYREASAGGQLTILLAGRPYHTDMLIQHKVSDMLADMGICVVTDDIVRGRHVSIAADAHYLSQWAYPNRILEAAKWSAGRSDMEFVEMTSFGCGPDAFLTDEVRDLLARHGKVLTLLKLDDINNVGSMKLRVRSLIESLRLASGGKKQVVQEFKTTPVYDKACRGRKIIVPYFTPFISPLIPAVMKIAGYDVDNLPLSDARSCEWGLKYANNEVCYPATLIVGDIIKAFRSGRYDPSSTAVAMTQTGGQCRASSYVPLIKKALVDAGYGEVPVVALALGGDTENNQPGFSVNWTKLLPVALDAVLYSDSIAKMYYAAVVRERCPGEAARLRDQYLQAGESLILEGRHADLISCLAMAAGEFERIIVPRVCPKVCVVGEIFLKFNPFAQKDVTGWLISRGVEVVPPLLLDFFMQSFVNRRVAVKTHLSRRSPLADLAYGLVYKKIRRRIGRFNRAASTFSRFTPFADIFSEAGEAGKVVSLSAQFGEGWLLPAEIMSCARQGVRNVVSLQPFGCIANHIVSKGIEKRIKQFFPDMNILSLDFDSGVSDVNVTNRLLLFVNSDNKQTSDKQTSRRADKEIRYIIYS